MIDHKLFKECCRKGLNGEYRRSGSGFGYEKNMHSILKNYYCPPNAHMDVHIEKFIADILMDDTVIDVRIHGYEHRQRKLFIFLCNHKVELIYPIFNIKWIRYIDTDTNELSKAKKSPKRETIYDIAKEILIINSYLGDPRVKLKLSFLEVVETRIKNSDSKSGKINIHSILPMDILEEIELNNIDDYRIFLPEGLSENFTRMDFTKLSKASNNNVFSTINLLKSIGIVERGEQSWKINH